MVAEGTPGKYSLWAKHPDRLHAIAETYPTKVAADARKANLELAGYAVTLTTLGKPA
jgi:hypothetical protein